MSETLSYNNLVAGDFPRKTKSVTLTAVAGALGLVLKKVLSGVIADDDGNTGNGAAGTLTVGKKALIGVYNITCKDLKASSITAGTVTEGTNTGDGVAGTATPGSAAKAGTYTLTCIDATVSGSEIFEVVDPDGVKLDDLTVGVAYSNNHFGLTIADGDTDFIVGDSFTIAMTATNDTPAFEVVAPSGEKLTDLLAGTAYDNGHFAVTIADGATDFAVGDLFTVTVTDAGTYEAATDPANVDCILGEALDASATGTAYMTGEFAEAALTVGSGTTVAACKEALRAKSIFLIDTQDD